jgi:cytochrome c oxidase assembly protein subunit 15
VVTHPPGVSLHRFAVLTALSTLALLAAGGLVTSHGVGMSVPDWPNSYGYNMFFFPPSRWVGGIFYEHTHRLVASAVGLLTTILALWLYGRSARPLMRWVGLALIVSGAVTWLVVPKRWTDAVVLGVTGLAGVGASFVWPRCEPSLRWLRRLGLVAFFAVVLQGVLGGLRVTEHKDALGIFHATLAQLFFVLMCAIALFTSQWWQRGSADGEALRAADGRARWRMLRPLVLGTTLLILAQLILGATMRHQHAGLAIPDFPLAYGKLWPATDSASVAHYNSQRIEVLAANPITTGQIVLQMVHRLVAVLILGAVAACAWLAWRRLGRRETAARLALAWLVLVMIQVLLGAATIWSNKAADIATAHVLVGALSLAAGAILTMVSFRERVASRQESAVPAGTILPRPRFGPAPATGME